MIVKIKLLFAVPILHILVLTIGCNNTSSAHPDFNYENYLYIQYAPRYKAVRIYYVEGKPVYLSGGTCDDARELNDCKWIVITEEELKKHGVEIKDLIRNFKENKEKMFDDQ